MRYFVRLAYDGTPFHGWQRQPNAGSVQQTLEEALHTVLRQPIDIVGAGRTDTGVNARVMYAHFDLPTPPEDKERPICPEDKGRLIGSLNRLCGPSIAIEDILPVKEDAHARFDACEREYRYFVIYSKSPFQRYFAWHSPATLDIDKMNEAASILIDTADFTSFAKLHSDAKTNICDVREAKWTDYTFPTGEAGLVFTIRADRFLRNMVRAVVGTLVDVGRNKIDIDSFRKIIEKKDRCAAGTSMPPNPLFLWDIKYPEDIFLPLHNS